MKRGFFILLFDCVIYLPRMRTIKRQFNEYQLIPYPNGLTPQKGSFKLTNGLPVIVQSPEAQCVADRFITRLKQCALMNLKVRTKGTPGQPAIYFQKQEGLHKEGYKLSVSNKQITVKASTANGFFYAVQTLYQLLPSAIYKRDVTLGLTWSIPAVEIEDEPRFAYRGLMLDVCRHFSPVGYIYRFIDMLAYHKMNVFHWHLTDDQGWRIEIKKYPKLIEIGSKRPETLIGYYFENYPQLFDGKEHQGYYTQEQIKEIVAYAASKHITVIPEIEMPGHALAALASYPELSCKPRYNFTGYKPNGASSMKCSVQTRNICVPGRSTRRGNGALPQPVHPYRGRRMSQNRMEELRPLPGINQRTRINRRQ